jgi:UDP-N-acetylmuramoyl-L-alanyl-D-glutamate--2,6-diaminopimelate ligase
MLAMTSRVTQVLEWLHATAPAAQLTSDSRRIEHGDVFLAYAGEVDGRKYIENAIERGALAVVYDDADGFMWNEAWNVPHQAVGKLSMAAGRIANAWYGKPDGAMFTVAVTGTNGKTSCSQWLARALSLQGEPAAAIGTLGAGVYKNGMAGEFTVTGYTTPDAVLLQRELAACRDAGAHALAIEASSIGLQQGRLNGMHVDAALFTNFTRDHLDYHGTLEAYEAAKTMLFDWPGLQHVVVNLDDAMGLRLAQRLRHNSPQVSVIGYSIAGNTADDIPVLQASEVRTSHAGTVFQLASPFGVSQVRLELVGEFNVSNVLGVAGVMLAKGIAWQAVLDSIEALTAVPGRMQQLGGQDAPLVVIDYAHTPDALEKTLAALRQVARQRSGQLWCLFGCGGDRDPGKRPQMGAVAAARADHVVLTSDNPRTENPVAIIEQILEGINAGGAGAEPDKAPPQVIEDRAAAILWTVKHAARSDVVLLAGKGHEAYQEIKSRKLPFLDADHAALALAARATMKGSP